VRFGLSISLADGHSWMIDDRKTRWLSARHPPSSSTLRARSWYEPELMNRDKCRARALQSITDMAAIKEGQLIDRRRLTDVPAADFDTELWTAAAAQSTGNAVDGFALAVGASLKRCVAIVFQTRAEGANASSTVGERLAVAARMIEGTQLRSELQPQDRVPLN